MPSNDVDCRQAVSVDHLMQENWILSSVLENSRESATSAPPGRNVRAWKDEAPSLSVDLATSKLTFLAWFIDCNQFVKQSRASACKRASERKRSRSIDRYRRRVAILLPSWRPKARARAQSRIRGRGRRSWGRSESQRTVLSSAAILFC